MDGEPHWRQHGLSLEVRRVGYCLLNLTMLSFSLLTMKSNPAVPVCSQVSKESRWELVQRSCYLQLQPSVVKCDVSAASPRRPMLEMVRLGR